MSSQTSDVSLSSELDELDELGAMAMTLDEIFSEHVAPQRVERLLCRTYETHVGCEFLRRARELLEGASKDFDEDVAVILCECLLVDYKLEAPAHRYRLEGAESPREAVLRIHQSAAEKLRDEAKSAALEPLLQKLAVTFGKLKANQRTLEFDRARQCERYGVLLALLGDCDGAIAALDEAVRNAIAAKALTRGAILFAAKLLAWLMELKRPGIGQLECIRMYSELIRQPQDENS